MLYNQPFDKPPEVTYGDTPYVNGNPSTGTPGSIPSAASIEYGQREIVNLIRDVGLLTPSNGDLHQLAKSVQSTLLYSDDDVGTANQYQVTQNPAPTAYFKYMTVVCRIANVNTGPSTLNVNGLGPKPIRHSNNTELAASELKQNSIVCFVYDGVIFQLAWSSVAAAGIIFLTAPRDIYVNGATGNDSTMDGSSATVVAGTIKGPFATCQRAADEAAKFNLNSFNITVHVAAGTYAGLTQYMPTGSGTLVWTGAGVAATTITGTNRSAMIIQGAGTIDVSTIKFTSTGSNVADPCAGIFTSTVRLNLHDVEFGQCSGYQLGVSRSSSCVLTGNIFLSGGSSGNAYASASFINCFFSSSIESSPAVAALNFNATAAINVGTFVVASQFGAINLTWTAFTNYGNVTGKRFDASLNGVINSSGGGSAYYPGTIVGTLSTGGQYA